MPTDASFIRVYRDGNAMGALVGRDLQEGESAWCVIEEPRTLDQQQEAGLRAVQLLIDRMPEYGALRLAWDPLR